MHVLNSILELDQPGDSQPVVSYGLILLLPVLAVPWGHRLSCSTITQVFRCDFPGRSLGFSPQSPIVRSAAVNL
jgi:hypothetical protein